MRLYSTESAGLATIDCDAGNVDLRGETLTADLRIPAKAKRIGISLTEPVSRARLTIRSTPGDHPEGATLDRIHNGGFEQDDAGWDVPKNKRMCQVVSEQAAAGRKALKIVDGDPAAGSNRLSSRMRAKPGGFYELRGSILPVSGSEQGLGIYARFYDARDRLINLPREERLKSIVITGGDVNEWQSFSKQFRTTENTRFMRIWIHSMNATRVEAYLDNLDIVDLGTPDEPPNNE